MSLYIKDRARPHLTRHKVLILHKMVRYINGKMTFIIKHLTGNKLCVESKLLQCNMAAVLRQISKTDFKDIERQIIGFV